MITDVVMAFVVAVFIELSSLAGMFFANFKQFVIFMCCVPIVLIYLVNGYQINFIGKMDFSIWILFVIMFDAVLVLLEAEIKKHIKE